MAAWYGGRSTITSAGMSVMAKGIGVPAQSWAKSNVCAKPV
jgi:hypothetical protein